MIGASTAPTIALGRRKALPSSGQWVPDSALGRKEKNNLKGSSIPPSIHVVFS